MVYVPTGKAHTDVNVVMVTEEMALTALVRIHVLSSRFPFVVHLHDSNYLRIYPNLSVGSQLLLVMGPVSPFSFIS